MLYSPFKVETLMEAKKRHPNGRWWIKTDACDLRKGLRESLSSVWAGGEDFDDGALKAMAAEYEKRCKCVNSVSARQTAGDTTLVEIGLRNDMAFFVSGSETAKANYEKALQQRTSETTMMDLAWDSIGYEELYKTM